MGQKFSRTTRIYNATLLNMDLEVRPDSGVPWTIQIQAGEHKDLCYRDFCLDDINLVKLIVLVSPAGVKFKESDKQIIMPRDIRDSSEIIISFEGGQVYVCRFKGKLRERIGFIRRYHDFKENRGR